MKKLIFILLMIAMTVGMVEAGTETCLWVWNIDPGTSTAAAPNEVHCDLDGRGYVSKPVTYIQNARGNPSIVITADSIVADGVTTSADLVSSGTTTAIPDNVNVQDIRILGSANCSTFDAGGVFYHTQENLQVDDTFTFSLTPPGCFKVQLGTSTDTGAGGGVVWTSVTW